MDDRQKQLIREERRKERRAAKGRTREERVAIRKAARLADGLTRATADGAPASGKALGPLALDHKHLHHGSTDLPLLFLSHHKCASSLAGGYVRQFCATNNLSFFGNAKGNTLPSARHDVSFLGNASYPFLAERVTTRGIHIIRNPLNVVLSAYYSHLRTHHVIGLPMLAAQRGVLEQCSVEEGIALTLAFCERNEFYAATPGPLCALRQWNFDNDQFTTVRMEEFGDRIDLALAGAMGTKAARYTWPEPHAFTFRAMSGGREPGTVDDRSPYRSGHPDAWRKELSKPIIAYIRAHYRSILERFYPNALLD
jgi:hypothetical protein